jgi:hypothetical protein
MSVLSLCFPCEKNSWNSKLFGDPICPFSTCWVNVCNARRFIRNEFGLGFALGRKSPPPFVHVQYWKDTMVPFISQLEYSWVENKKCWRGDPQPLEKQGLQYWHIMRFFFWFWTFDTAPGFGYFLRLPCPQGREKNLRKNLPRNAFKISVSFSTNFA